MSRYSRFLCNRIYDITELSKGSIPFSHRKHIGRKKRKRSNKRKKMKEKRSASVEINSCEKFKIE